MFIRRMIICDDKKRKRKQVFVVHFKVLFWDLPRITEEYNENLYSL
jgi:hypothetical protein